MDGPLAGVKVFDLTVAGVGPWASKLLGEMGAEVIHVDAPSIGFTNALPTVRGMSLLMIICNYNKRGIFLDLKARRDRLVAYRLLESCDVFLANMRPGAVDRLGLSYDEVSKINPRIVYCLASGFGERGPMAPVPGAAPQISAFSGWSSTTGERGKPGEFFRHSAHLDFNTSAYIVEGILQGLLHRERTGIGQKIEVDMTSAAISLQTSRFAEFFATGKTPPSMGSTVTTTVPHQAFLCQDKQYIMVGVVEDDQWLRFCKAIGNEELAKDPRFASNPLRVQNRELLIPILDHVFVAKPIRWWEIRLTEAQVPNGRIRGFEELRWHPQIVENEHMVKMTTPRWGTLYVDGMPWRFSGTPGSMRPGFVPGEHTEEVLRELGMVSEG